MRMRLNAMIFTALLVGCAGAVQAADIARLEWGGFVVDTDSSNGWDGWKAVSSDDGRSVAMTFDSLDAKADGAMAESSEILTGHYEVMQPAGDDYSSVEVVLEGLVIKSSDATTRLSVTVAGIEKIIEWPAGAEASEKYKRVLDFKLAGEGRLPTPLAVGLKTFASKGIATDAAYVSIMSMTITAGNAKIASR